MTGTEGLRIAPPETFDDEVRITAHGNSTPLVLLLTFRHMGKRAANEWLRQTTSDAERLASTALLDIVVAIGNNKESQYAATEEGFRDLLDNYPNPFRDILEAWLNALSGEREKN